jgi:sugar/nucleoside kinase (ribokinase family)
VLSQRPEVDLLVIGGLTIDRFADGTSAAGGSVLHSTRAAVAEGATVGVVTVSGEEPEAVAALEALAELCTLVRQPARGTVVYRHREADGRRVLILDRLAERLTAQTMARAPRGRVAVFAPIADELPVGAVTALRAGASPRRSVALIQGWLRRLEEGHPADPLPLDSMAPDLRRELAAMDAVIASTEDLVAVADEPLAQLHALREAIGSRPVAVLTLGTDGYLLDDPAADRITASYPREVITGVPTVGAGDIYGAAMAYHLGRDAPPASAAAAAAEAVIRMLEQRRGGAAG